MPDGSNLIRTSCPRCAAHDACVPLEEELRELVSGDGAENGSFIPRQQTPEQVVAAAAYTRALSLFIAAYGLEASGARLNHTLGVVRKLAKLSRIDRRQMAAREALARARLEAGEIGPAQAAAYVLSAGSALTPDYEGKERDDAWLREFGA